MAGEAGGGGGRGGAALWWAFVVTTALVAGLDLWTKHLAFSRLAPYEVVEVAPGWLNIVLSENRGAAFGILAGRMTFFVVVSVAAFAFLLYLLRSARPGTTWRFGVTTGLIAGGVVGNLHDRLRYGRVRDFIDVYVSWDPLAGHLERWFGTAHWPTFNVADAAICVGAIALVIKLWGDEHAAETEKAARADGVPSAESRA